VRFNETATWDLLKSAASITIAKGKKFQKFEEVGKEKESIIKGVMGPSGNLRAPTYRVGNDFMIGFNRDAYSDWFDT